MAYQIQQAISKGKIVEEFKSKWFSDKDELDKLLPNINNVLLILQKQIPESIRKLTISVLKSKKNYGTFVSYMHHMANYLQQKEVASFTPLPNPKLQRRHFLFDKKFLCSVYNKWVDDEVSMAYFEKHYEYYYKKMFKTHIIYKKLCEKMSFPKSYVTDGYAVSIIFSPKEPPKKKKKARVNNRIIFTHPENRCLKPRLYEADDTRMTQEQIEKYHITSIDPGNRKMFNCITYDYGKGGYGESYIVNKGYYNEISHINRNHKKVNKLIRENLPVTECYKKLSDTCIRGGSSESYLAYMEIIADNWDLLWEHELEEDFAKIKYDKYIHAKMAVGRICREMLAHNKTKGPRKPSLFIIGKGNGNMTISNTKNSSSHGPIKRIVYALSLLVPVILTDENMTSQLCNRCLEKVTYPKMHFRKKASNTSSSPAITTRTVYGLCYCSHAKHENKENVKRQIIWKRDDNSARCILRSAIGKLKGHLNSAFAR